MCMITYLPPHVKVPMTGIANGGQWNNDGHGWAIAAETGVMLTGKSMDLDIALESFRAAREKYPAAPALFHSRWATHGVVDTSNVHPFYVAGKAHAGNVVVAHNGVLPAAFHPGKKDRRSDTRIMADEWLGKQSNGTWTKKERKRVGNLIGPGNKLAILSVSPQLDKPRGYLVNGSRGEWVKGAWFSNGDHWSGYARGRYAWTGYHGTGYGYSTVSGKTTVHTGKYGGTYESAYSGGMFGIKDECPMCFGTDHIDLAAGVCTFCNTCLDCFENTRDCLCYVPESTLDKALDTMQAVCIKCGESALGDCDCSDIATGESDKTKALAVVESFMQNQKGAPAGGWYQS